MCFKKNLIILLILLCISYIYHYKSLSIAVFNSRINIEDYDKLKSIKYNIKTESFSQSQGKFIKYQEVYYVYPYKLRIDTISETKIVEIYNAEKHYYYDELGNKIRVKEAFPPRKPYVIEIIDKVNDIIKSGKYEFFGYEEKENLKMEVLGIKNKIDDHSYMHKIWISEINNVLLPVKEEYFIDGRVVEKSEYIYEVVNGTIDNSMFEISSLPKVEVVNDGYLAKHFETLDEAKKYLNFSPKVHKDLEASYISVTPPISNPCLTLVYIYNGSKIILNQWTGREEVNFNAKLGNIKVLKTLEGEMASIRWCQNGVVFYLTGEKNNIDDIIRFAEEITNEKFTMQGE